MIEFVHSETVKPSSFCNIVPDSVSQYSAGEHCMCLLSLIVIPEFRFQQTACGQSFSKVRLTMHVLRALTQYIHDIHSVCIAGLRDL